MGPIDPTPLIYVGILIGVAIAAAFFGLGLGAYWLWNHLDIVWSLK